MRPICQRSSHERGEQVKIKITVSEGAERRFPDGKPIISEKLPSGAMRHTMSDGRVLTVHTPTYTLHYLSNWVGVPPGTTYQVPVAISGLSTVDGYFEAWNFDLNELRNYSFSKTVKIVHMKTGEEITGMELKKDLNDLIPGMGDRKR
jgi:hypothetical protein